MGYLSTFTGRLQTLANLIENPKLISLRRYGVHPKEFCSMNQPWLRSIEFATIIDIGANKGQFAMTINAVFPQAQIYSFEPIPECFKDLINCRKFIDNFTAFNFGLGDDSGDLEFEKNMFTASSSFLKMAEVHKEAFPFTKDSKTINVKIERLDNIVENLTLTEPLLIKIDVQGYEDRVLQGGMQTIKRAKLIIIETSFQKLYEEQPLFDNIYCQLKDWGFVYQGSFDQLYSPQNGKILQANSCFVKGDN
ncbi:MAG: FkbM family methyltransferase [Nostocales cyanobacterium 94392]|nr:FkbM family methyltransferase [Nostocales cyanobacterium 94392]